MPVHRLVHNHRVMFKIFVFFMNARFVNLKNFFSLMRNITMKTMNQYSRLYRGTYFLLMSPLLKLYHSDIKLHVDHRSWIMRVTADLIPCFECDIFTELSLSTRNFMDMSVWFWFLLYCFVLLFYYSIQLFLLTVYFEGTDLKWNCCVSDNVVNCS